MSEDRDLIITAASDSYRGQLLAFLGSMRCNWPGHPRVRVYDMGLGDEMTYLLSRAGFEVRKIPSFVPHWRKHYTWKLWCMNDASAERVLWLDAGCCILRPVPEIFEIIGHQGYFALSNYQPLEIEAHEEACEGCCVSPQFRSNKLTVTAAVFGFERGSAAQHVVQEGLEVARTERYIMAKQHWHRWEQAILSLLMYRDISPLILCDAHRYFYEDLRANITTQSIWAARKSMHYRDKKFLASCLEGPVSPFVPRASHKTFWWYKVARQPKATFRAAKNLLGAKRPIDGVK